MRVRAAVRLIVKAICLTAVLVGFGAVGVRPATSDPEPAPDHPVPASVQWHVPFTPYAADEGALTFEQLDAHEQALVAVERERESPAELAARFDALKAMTITRGERTHAEMAASMVGLEGLANEGVLP